jgi:hypothetical protein
MARTQISAEISAETKQRFERYTEAHGLKKGFVVEQALLHHLQAVAELPADVIIPARLVVSADSFAAMAARFETPLGPTPAMTALRSGNRSQVGDDDLG